MLKLQIKVRERKYWSRVMVYSGLVPNHNNIIYLNSSLVITSQVKHMLDPSYHFLHHKYLRSCNQSFHPQQCASCFLELPPPHLKA